MDSDWKKIRLIKAYDGMMPAVKRIPVAESVWRDLTEMRSAGQTYSELLSEMIEERKRRMFEDDVKIWNRRNKKDYVSLVKIDSDN